MISNNGGSHLISPLNMFEDVFTRPVPPERRESVICPCAYKDDRRSRSNLPPLDSSSERRMVIAVLVGYDLTSILQRYFWWH